MTFLTALLTVLLVADASFLLVHSQRLTNEPEGTETSTEQPIFVTTDGPVTTTPDFDNLGEDNYTDDSDIPQTVYVQWGIERETVFYLDAYKYSALYVNISSNTTENTNYSNNQNNKLQLVAGDAPVWLTVYLQRFDLENSTHCSYDYLRIGGAKICGLSSEPKYFSYVLPANETFTIKFCTDGSVTASGIRIIISTYETISGVVSYQPYGVISNPNYIVNYQEVNQTDYVDLANDDSYVPTPSNDYPTPRYTPSNDYPSPSYTESPYDSIIECGNGNTDNYYYLVDNNYGNTDSYYTQYISTSNRYLLRSTNFGYGNYGNNTLCKVKFYTGSTRQRLAVYFNAFDVESFRNCSFDSLCMGGVKLCSTWPQGRYFYYEIAPYNYFTFVFKTDVNVVKPGFEASLSFYNVDQPYGSYEATSGDGSNEDTVVYSYVDTSSYQDRCASDYYNTPAVYNPEPSTPEPRFDYDNSNYANSFKQVVLSRLDEAVDKINIAEELIDNLGSPQVPQNPQYRQY